MASKNLSIKSERSNCINNHLGKTLGLAIAAVVLLLIGSVIFAREDVVDGQTAPDKIDDRDAWELLFLVCRKEPGEDKWDHEFLPAWLAEGGLEPSERTELSEATRKYWAEIESVDQQIEEVARKGRDDRKINDLINLRKAKLDGIVMDIPSQEKIRGFLHEKIKKQTTAVTQQVGLGSLLPLAYGQTMTGSMILTTVTSRVGLVISARGAASTQGAYGHKVKISTEMKHVESGRAVTTMSSLGFRCDRN